MRVTVNCVCCWLFRWIRLLHRYFIHLRKPQRWRVMCSSRRPCHLSSHHPRLDVCTRWGGNGIANGLKITAALLDSDSQWMSKWGNCQRKKIVEGFVTHRHEMRWTLLPRRKSGEIWLGLKVLNTSAHTQQRAWQTQWQDQDMQTVNT